ncbi:vesicle transport protein USE1 isoform X3 [Sphaerodactylus townsendi]|uniref:vesicle transport protein USE1 isoform X3 n=1 Tax=Sphaerodactylus townsendi TaxID=933632 RepID=UPI0020269F5A|nr:vesicle transport protein USE1 isoform X3 [Sphaerodactylus townsendi]
MAMAGRAGAMPVPRAELKLVRLLSRCEALAAGRPGAGEWRLEKYVAALEEMLLELKKHSSKPAPEVLSEYSRKVDFLKGMLEAEKMSSSSEKALATQFLAPGRTPTTTKERIPATQTVHLQTQARYTREMRSELLGTESLGNPVAFCRGLLPEEKQSAADLDAVLQHHHSIQEKLAEEMLHLARNLKNNTLVAQNVIKQDNQTLSHSLKLADQNFEKLKDESSRLEQHAKKSVNWLLWLMLIVVCFIFISMILFIRIFPKLR